ncbi:CapA family protein [Pseudooceanicola algae]|uniref:Capsule biosynthesis protein CapA n=1 Tax=Pseudooceanicola algae TaxID=1537215 RepID=A0A418SLE3_9RHOB|nr:CapA family protein [Pseudooceanicola algae]QPM90562.1 Capsule biosynthesis protein CapA [Pseudooceanicola algae]
MTVQSPISIVLCGDTLPVRPVTGLPASAQEVFAIAAGADLSIGNFEIPLTDRGQPVEKLLNIRTSPDVADSTPALGLKVVTIANNHAVDYGREGLEDTERLLRQAGLDVIGAGTDRARAARLTVHRVGGVRVGIIAFSTLTPTGMAASDLRGGISGLHVETGYEIDPWYQQEEPGDPSVVKIRTRIRAEDLTWAQDRVRAARADCDVLIVTLHWGFGSGEDLAEYQRPLAEAMIDAGADVIHGHHPHAIHAIGFHAGKPILFSAGTYLGQQVLLPASDAVRTLWAGMSPDGFVTRLDVDPVTRRLAQIEIIATTLDADQLPRRTTAPEEAAILSRIERLSRPHGAQLKQDAGRVFVLPLA